MLQVAWHPESVLECCTSYYQGSGSLHIRHYH